MTRTALPVWNKRKFRCPLCARTWEPNTIRIKKLGNQWVCHRCYNTADHPGLSKRNPGAPGQRVDPTPELFDTPCSTCGQPIRFRRAITSAATGLLVHYRCPTVKVASQQ